MLSVLSQNYPDLEYIVVDDGSTDASIPIINKYSGSIKLVAKANGGLPTAINAGFQKATGSLICWLDSDNLLLPGALRKVATTFSTNPLASMIYGDFIKINEEGRPIAMRKQPSFDYDICLYGYLTVSNAAVFFSRKLLAETGYADETLRCACDMDLFLRFAKLGPVIHVSEYLGAYRIHQNSMSILQADRHSNETWSVRLKHTSPNANLHIMRILCSWHKLRVVIRMILEGVIWCRIWPVKDWLLPECLPTPKSGTPKTIMTKRA
jgi:glycosyltransferase involved in cell wall biosynthesis